MNDKKIDIDQLFNRQLSEAEEAFDPNAWEQMQQKLNENDNRKGGVIIVPNKSTKIKTITIMTTLIASVVAISIYNFSPLQPATADLKNTSVEKNTISVAKANSTNNAKQTASNSTNYRAGINQLNASINIYKSAATSAPIAHDKNTRIAETTTPQSKIIYNNVAPLPAYKLSFNGKLETEETNPDSAKIAKFILGNKRYRYDKPWIGFHLTGMMPLGTLHDSGYRPGLGFNIEVMSADILKAKYMGLSLGGSMGVLWNGFSKKQDVILATPNNDSGYTRIYNMGFHLDFIARAEFGNYRLKPYLDAVLGIRNVSTFQSINSDQNIQGYSGNTNTMLTSWALQYGVSAGLRWHWVPGVSVDLRGTLYNGGNLNFIDVKHTPYNANTTTYSPQTHTAPGDMFVLRLGLLFDLDEMDYDYHHKENNNYNNTTTTYQQTNGKSTPIYDNKGNNGSSGSGSSPRIGGSIGGSTPKIPLTIKAVPIRK